MPIQENYLYSYHRKSKASIKAMEIANSLSVEELKYGGKLQGKLYFSVLILGVITILYLISFIAKYIGSSGIRLKTAHAEYCSPYKSILTYFISTVIICLPLFHPSRAAYTQELLALVKVIGRILVWLSTYFKTGPNGFRSLG